jgi:hypothetical protein
MQHGHGAWHGSCPCFVYLLHVHAGCLFCMSTLHVHAACQYCMSMLHVHASFPCDIYCFMSMLHDHAACPCCMPMSHVCAACLCCLSMPHVLAACPCYWLLLSLNRFLPQTAPPPSWRGPEKLNKSFECRHLCFILNTITWDSINTDRLSFSGTK